MKYTLPVKISREWDEEVQFEDSAGDVISFNDILNMLTEYLETKQRQEECDHCYEEVDVWDFEDEQNSTFIKVPYASVPAVFGNNKMEYPHCPKCGADLTKGATHES